MLKKFLLGLAGLLVVIALGFYLYVQMNWDKVYDYPYPELTASTDSATIAYGKYLVHGPAHCSNCHVPGIKEMIAADGGENIPLIGGIRFPMGPLGSISPANLTPDPETGIGRYKDGEIFRMMRHTVKPDGTATLSLFMPFWNMADEDLVAVVSYLRSMEPRTNKIEPPQWTFMGKAIRVFAPSFKPIEQPTPPPKAPPMAPTKERGEYLSRYVANCVGCHTKHDPMTYAAIGSEYAGGEEFEPFPPFNEALGLDPNLGIRSVNITPHPNSALSRFKSLEEWIARFRQGRVIKHSPMHWGPFSRMSDEDLEALWIYLNSLEPVENDIKEIVFLRE